MDDCFLLILGYTFSIIALLCSATVIDFKGEFPIWNHLSNYKSTERLLPQSQSESHIPKGNTGLQTVGL